MEKYQFVALFLALAPFYVMFQKISKVNKSNYILDFDKRKRIELINNYYMVYIAILSVFIIPIWFSKEILTFVNSLGLELKNAHFVGFVIIFIWALSFYLNIKFDFSKEDNSEIYAKPSSTYQKEAKFLNIDVVDGEVLDKKIIKDLNYIIRRDDYTIQKTTFDKKTISLKIAYLEDYFKKNKFTKEDFAIIDEIKNNISKTTGFKFADFNSMKTEISNLLKYLKNEKKYTFSFGQIKQYSKSDVLDEIIIFMQEFQEDKFSDCSLPYLKIFEKEIRG